MLWSLAQGTGRQMPSWVAVGGLPGGWHPYLGEEHHETAVVREFQVLGVELMESLDVTLDEVLLLII